MLQIIILQAQTLVELVVHLLVLLDRDPLRIHTRPERMRMQARGGGYRRGGVGGGVDPPPRFLGNSEGGVPEPKFPIFQGIIRNLPNFPYAFYFSIYRF